MTELFADFGLRDWLLILGPLFIVGILIHGYWRMRVNRNSLKMRLDKSFLSENSVGGDDGDELSMLRAELPNGGARVFTPEQGDLNLEENVPVLMDPVEEPSEREHEQSAHEVDEPAEPIVTESPKEPPTPKEPRPEKYVVLNVMAIGESFKGQELLETLVEQNLSLGEMNIFHRVEKGLSQFSLMNAVEPGSFDLNEMSGIETPAVSMFMRVHELDKPTQVFEEMLQVAERIAEELGGEVRDESRSVMTSQTIEHCRQDLEEYEFKNPA